ncbi:MAG: hypothetical protein ACHP9Y_03065 [Gammaproteobacteria bacterium]
MAVFLSLGSVTFANFEIPTQINGGGAQGISVKQLIGGQRVVDALGRIDDDIEWNGLLFGPTAQFRSEFLDGMRVAGLPQLLTYSGYNYSVVIKHYHWSFERFYQIKYSISCTVVQDLNQPINVLVPVAYNDAIINLLTEANDLAFQAANPSVISAMAILSDTINNLASISGASNAELAVVAQQIAVASQAVNDAIVIANGEIF